MSMKSFMAAISLLLILSSQAQDPKLPKEVRHQFAGTWSLLAVENTNADGSKTLPYGENPVGLLVLTTDGKYAIQILKSVRPKVAANDKNKATAEEKTALVQGNNSHFGTYSVDLLKRTITFNVQHAFYPNWEGTVQIRSYTLEDNTLSYIVTHTTNGGSITAKVIWRKN